MELYIDRWLNGNEAPVLTPEEVDIVADAIQTLLFKDFFVEPWQLLSVHAMRVEAAKAEPKENEGSSDEEYEDCDDQRIIYVKSGLPGLEQSTVNDLYRIWTDQATGVFNAIEIASGDKPISCGAQIGRIPDTDIYIVSSVLKFGNDYILIFLSAKTRESLVEGCNGICGLIFVFCFIMSTRFRGGLDMQRLEFTIGNVVDRTTCSAIRKRVTSWLSSGRESIEKWRKVKSH